MRNQAVRALFYSAPFASPSASLTVETGGQQRCGSTYKGRHSVKARPLTRRRGMTIGCFGVTSLRCADCRSSFS